MASRKKIFQCGRSFTWQLGLKILLQLGIMATSLGCPKLWLVTAAVPPRIIVLRLRLRVHHSSLPATVTSRSPTEARGRSVSREPPRSWERLMRPLYQRSRICAASWPCSRERTETRAVIASLDGWRCRLPKFFAVAGIALSSHCGHRAGGRSLFQSLASKWRATAAPSLWR